MVLMTSKVWEPLQWSIGSNFSCTLESSGILKHMGCLGLILERIELEFLKHWCVLSTPQVMLT